MNETYRPLVEGLRAASITVYFQGPDQLVVSRQHGPVLPSRGNSFWMSHRGDSWYLCTWAPTCYRIPPEADLVRLCAEFMDHGQSAQPRIPPTLVERYRLIELSEDEAGPLLGL